MSHPFLDAPHPIAFAHRGGAGEAAENTLEAFEAAVRLGYRYLETDLHVTLDGLLVAFHDDRLDRVSDRRGAISELPWVEVRAAVIEGSGRVPLLEELLEALPGARLNLDPKSDAAAAALPGVLRRTRSLERVCVGSFSDARLGRLRAEFGSALCTSLGPREVAALRLAAWRVPAAARFAVAGGGQCVQVPVRQGPLPLIDRSFVATAHHLGLPVHAWTIDDPDEMEELLELGVDGLMTDRPALLRDVLLRRGAGSTTGTMPA